MLVGVPDGNILSANAAACRMFGGTEARLREVGRQGISYPDDPAWQRLLEERDRTGAATGVVPMRRLDGFPLLMEVSTAIIEAAEGDARTCVILRDVTERVRMERRLVAYDEITEALLAEVDTDQVLEMLAHHACSIFDASYSSVMVPTEDGEGARVVAAFGKGAEHMTGRTFPPGGMPDRVIRSGQPLLVADVTAVARTEEVRALGVGSAIVAPIGQPDAVVGVLFVGGDRSRYPYQESDLEEAGRYAARAGVIIAIGRNRARAEMALRQTSEQLQHALQSRVVIEQAKGFVACVRHVTADEAFAMLRKYARSHNVGLHTVARQVLERRLVV